MAIEGYNSFEAVIKLGRTGATLWNISLLWPLFSSVEFQVAQDNFCSSGTGCLFSICLFNFPWESNSFPHSLQSWFKFGFTLEHVAF